MDNDEKYEEKDTKKEEDKSVNAITQRSCSPQESLKKSLKEMKLISKGDLPKKSWREFKKELDKEN